MAINKNNKLHSLATMMTAAMLSSSCSLVGPDYVKPESAVETKWINQSSPEISKRTVELSTWWKVFNDPVLDFNILLIPVSPGIYLTMVASPIRFGLKIPVFSHWWAFIAIPYLRLRRKRKMQRQVF